VFVDPAHELPRSSIFVGDFLNLEIEKRSLGVFDCFLETLPILKLS